MADGDRVQRILDLAGWRGRRAWRLDWPAIEAALGHALPSDYKHLCENLPPGRFGGFLILLHPASASEGGNLLAQERSLKEPDGLVDYLIEQERIATDEANAARNPIAAVAPDGTVADPPADDDEAWQPSHIRTPDVGRPPTVATNRHDLLSDGYRSGTIRIVTERVRAVATTHDGHLVTIKRVKPGTEPYWVLPGGGIEPDDATPEAALARELAEELGGIADIGARVITIDGDHSGTVGREHFYLARLHTYDLSRRDGPEFTDPSRGEYLLDLVPLTPTGLASIMLLPPRVAKLLDALVRAGGSLSELPDLATDQ